MKNTKNFLSASAALVALLFASANVSAMYRSPLLQKLDALKDLKSLLQYELKDSTFDSRDTIAELAYNEAIKREISLHKAADLVGMLLWNKWSDRKSVV